MNVSVKDLKKKMTSLLGSYRRERSREKKSQVTGSGQGDVYKSQWFGYTLFDFLSDKDTPNDTFDTMENANTQRGPEENREESYNDESIVDEPATVEDEPPASTNTTMASVTATAASTSTATAPTSNISQARKRKRRNDADNAQNEMLLDAYSILKKTSATPTDHYETFGMHVASELRKYDSNTLPHVKRAISDVLFRADIGEFTPNHNVLNTYGYYSSFSTPTQRNVLVGTLPAHHNWHVASTHAAHDLHLPST
ncbi:uncharacterized protein LOC134528882 [Bacillus rossius redtenbacheri]|uniref:uncharacterized protein LOC134528882 n=1 Tax=Bacillus rossius redtenbacheri TaxID=93214 RepID=UPI002FDE26A4